MANNTLRSLKENELNQVRKDFLNAYSKATVTKKKIWRSHWSVNSKPWNGTTGKWLLLSLHLDKSNDITFSKRYEVIMHLSFLNRKMKQVHNDWVENLIVSNLNVLDN